MACEYCGYISGHAFRCPKYKSPSSSYSCAICNDGIQIGERYIVNDSGDYAHWECIDYAKDLAEFLGYEIKEIEED